MVELIKEPSEDEEIFKTLNPTVRKWFKERFGSFSESQRYAIKPIHKRKNILVSAPTGSGKTLCAFTSILNYLINLSNSDSLEDKIYCVYVSPLKALSRDIHFNLKEPLKEMQEIAEKEFGIRIAVRTGDTSSYQKSKMLKKPPHILITTPESLGIVITTKKFVNLLTEVEFAIVDEIHSLASSKRGTHLALSLERLQNINKSKIVRIGLSATIAPLKEMAKFLVGYEEGEPRSCLIADVRFVKDMDLKVLSPVSDLIKTSGSRTHDELYKLLDELVQKHETTLIFTNTRSATERVINHLKEKFPSKYGGNIGAHHSSLSKKLRYKIEDRLRKGELKVAVSSTSLELGIDIGHIDLVILLSSPKSVARGLQRIGRSGHQLRETAKGRLIVLDRDDLVECSVLLKEAVERHIDKIKIPENCLDVLSQKIYGMAIQRKWKTSELLEVIRRSYPYRNLSSSDFYNVIKYLAGEYPGLENKRVYAKIWYDQDSGMVGRRGKLARVIYMTNIGTIPDESYAKVMIAYPKDRKGEQVGMIDEAFLEHLRKGDVFVLGGSKYKFLYSKGMKVYVNASVKKPPTIPSWFSEMLPLSFDLALQIQRFRKLMNEKFKSGKGQEEIKKFIRNYLYLDEKAVNAVYNYFNQQYEYAEIPHKNKLLVEYYKDSKGKQHRFFHTVYGRRVNDALSRALGYLVGKYSKRDVEVGVTDNGFYLASFYKMQVNRAFRELKSSNLEEILEKAVIKTEMFRRRFRHCATRSLMILRSYKGRKKSVGKQQLKSRFILGAVKKLGEEFPILKETKREVMEDLMDAEHAKKVLKEIEKNKIKVKNIHTEVPTPFAFHLITQARSDLMKIEDKIEFLKRMHKQVLSRIEK